MLLKRIYLTNFGSFPTLEFSFDNKGLTLIHGKTGVGKSTFQDAASWVITGQSSSGCAVDDIRPWGLKGGPTKGVLEVDDIVVTRIRGTNENDLFWTESTGEIRRGKDIQETQKLFYSRLGVDYESFTTGSTFNEFSSTGHFFTAKAKARKEFFETLVDLSFPSKLLEKIQDDKKLVKKQVLKFTESLNLAQGALESKKKGLIDCESRILSWEVDRLKTITGLVAKCEEFESNKRQELELIEQKFQSWGQIQSKKIESIKSQLISLMYERDKYTGVCQECGQEVKKHTELTLRIRSLEGELRLQEATLNPFDPQKEKIKARDNNYGVLLEKEGSKINPFMSQKSSIICDIEDLGKKIKSIDNGKLQKEYRLRLLNKLQELSDSLRVELLRSTIKWVETSTNKYLETYFDSEFRISFELKEKDTLNVQILKNGYEASYPRLSRGQRCMLRLCFVLSVMQQVANKNGVHFDCLFFDEILDGMDESLKIKSYRIFEEFSLRHSTILFTDHNSEFKNLFNNKFEVTMVEDCSAVREE